MAEIIYILCAATSLACAVLLLRGYLQSRAQLLLWCSLCFIGLALNNALLVIDRIVVPQIDLSLWRLLAAFAGIGVLIFGLIWEGD